MSGLSVRRGRARPCARIVFASVAAAALFSASSALAQFSSDFENPPYTGSPGGTVLNGQDGFYLPAAGGVSAGVYTYNSNVLQFPQNPNGNAQFAAAVGPGGGTFARSQRDMPFGAGVWTIAFDTCMGYLGSPPSAQNIGSLSLQDSVTTASFIALSRWVDINTPDSWNADYVWYDAAGNSLTEQVPDSRFQNLRTYHWYRWSTIVDFDTNQILEVALTDLTTGTTATHNPVDRYLQGGAAGGFPLPTGFRLFGGAENNVMGFDNLDIGLVPAPGALALLGAAGLIARRRRRA